MTGAAVRGDAVRLPLRDGSVDLIVTSPPYFALRSYQDGGEHYDGQIGSETTPAAFLAALWACTAEWQRVLKPTGSLWVNLGDKYGRGTRTTVDGSTDKRANGDFDVAATGMAKSLMGLPWRYAIGCIDGHAGDPWVLRAEVVWNKPNGMPESVTDRVRRSHEQFFHLTREGDYFAAMDEIREPHAATSVARSQRARVQADEFTVGSPHSLNPDQMCHPRGKLPGSVWTITSDPLVISEDVKEAYGLPDHYAAFPQEWPRRIILGWCPPGGVVLDPFSGTGTVAGVANTLGRTGIGVDLSYDYCRLGQWFLRDGRRFAKAASRTDAERQGALL